MGRSQQPCCTASHDVSVRHEHPRSFSFARAVLRHVATGRLPLQRLDPDFQIPRCRDRGPGSSPYMGSSEAESGLPFQAQSPRRERSAILALARPPRVRARALNPPEPDGVLRLVAEAELRDPDLAWFLLLAATTGPCRGELCAIRWSDLDRKAGSLTISRSIVETRGAILIEKDTKTLHPVGLPWIQAQIAALTTPESALSEESGSCRATLADSAHGFSADPDGERPWVPNEVTKQFIRIRRSIGLDSVRLHDLRHFTATHMLSEGVPVRTVSGRLGRMPRRHLAFTPTSLRSRIETPQRKSVRY